MGFNKNGINEEFPYFDVFERMNWDKESFTRSHIEIKINKQGNLVSFDPANFDMSELYKENFQS